MRQEGLAGLPIDSPEHGEQNRSGQNRDGKTGGARPAPANAKQALPAKANRLIVHAAEILEIETPAALLDTWITPTDLFFVRNHLSMPDLRETEWRLRVTGEVERPLELSLEDLRRMESACITNTLECAGNGRAFYHPRTPGSQWERGAVGNAHFAGPLVAGLLERAGLKSGAKHVAFDGYDGPIGNIPDFIRSIPIEKAMDGATMVALEMNGALLRREHGFPARAVVPGWIGSASVKWLSEIRVLDHEFEGAFMNPGYRMPNRPGRPGEPTTPGDTHAATALGVKSMITKPGSGLLCRGREISVSGAAWAGEDEIVRVDISVDHGKTWTTAQLGPEKAKCAWRLWSCSWTPPEPGEFTILSRATDSRGNVQPETPGWNANGYLWNGMDRARVTVS